MTPCKACFLKNKERVYTMQQECGPIFGIINTIIKHEKAVTLSS